MAGFDINSFKANFSGGARAYLFLWTPTFPGEMSNSLTTEKMQYLVRSTSMPEDTSEEIVVNWQGADFKMAGKRTFADWTITVNTDRQALVRSDFNKWMKLIHNIDKDGDGSYGSPGQNQGTPDYTATQVLQMLDYEGTPLNTVTLSSAWLKTVGAITLDYSSMDVAQFDLTFTYLYHTIESA